MINRRGFISGLGVVGSMSAMPSFGDQAKKHPAAVRFGVVSDLHYGDIPAEKKPIKLDGQRFWRESKRKLSEAVRVFNRHQMDFVIELGDFKDFSHDRETTLKYLEEIEGAFAEFQGPRYHVFGNHDFDCLTVDDLAPRMLNDGKRMTSGHYSFVKNGISFIVLDACYDSQMVHYASNNPWFDANVPPEQVAWLKAELDAAKGPAIVFCHQRLDPSASPKYLVRNAAEIRDIIEKSGKVKTVFTGHQHMGSIYEHNGVLYYTVIAQVIDSGPRANSFAEVFVDNDGSVRVTGYFNAVSYGSAKGDAGD